MDPFRRPPLPAAGFGIDAGHAARRAEREIHRRDTGVGSVVRTAEANERFSDRNPARKSRIDAEVVER